MLVSVLAGSDGLGFNYAWSGYVLMRGFGSPMLVNFGLCHMKSLGILIKIFFFE